MSAADGCLSDRRPSSLMERWNKYRPIALVLIALLTIAILIAVASRFSQNPDGTQSAGTPRETPTVKSEISTATTAVTPQPTDTPAEVTQTDTAGPTQTDTPSLTVTLMGTATFTDTSTPRQAATHTPTESPTPIPMPTMTQTPLASSRVKGTATPLPPSPTPAPPIPILTELPCIGVAFLHEGDIRCAVTNLFVEQFTLGANAYQFTWSPDGNALAITVVRVDRTYILRALTDGTQVDNLGEGFNPSWSPDSQWLVFQRDDQIWRMRAGGSDAVQLTHQEGWRWSNSVFTRDGQAVLLAGAPASALDGYGNTSFYFYIVPISGGDLTRLSGMARMEGGRLPHDVEFSADGTRFAYRISHQQDTCLISSDIRSAQVDGSDNRSLVPKGVRDSLQGRERRFIHADSFAWSPVGNEVALTAAVFECSDDALARSQVVVRRSTYIVDGFGNEVRSWNSEARQLGWHRRGIALVYVLPGSGASKGVVYISNVDGERVLRVEAGSKPKWKPS